MVQRWTFTDFLGELATYTFRRNPSEMSSPYPMRQITAEHTSSGLDGQPLVWEGPPQLQDMTFSGTLIDKQDWDDFTQWVYNSRGHVMITDHLGRQMDVVFRKFEPTIQAGIKVVNGVQKPYYGKYTITALVFSVN